MELYFKKEGQGEPLFILHGLFGSSDNWTTIGKKFAVSNTVYLIDQRNHGRSPHSEDWSYTLMADDLIELMRKEGIKKAHLLGHSMGGKTVMNLAVSHPDLCKTIIIVDISPAEYPVHHREILDALLSVNLDEINSRGEAEEKLNVKITDTGTLQFLLKNLYWKDAVNKKLDWRFNLPVLNNKIDIVGDGLNSLDIKEDLNFPALFIKGEKSNYVKPSDEELIRSFFSRSEIKVIKNAGHWVHAEQPEEFFKVVTEFIDRN